MHLFVIYIGTSHPNAFIELHDMRFVIAHSIEETYPALRKSWWGIPSSLHIDAWGILDYADGHRIQISKDKPEEGGNTLFFVNLGGYSQKEFTELHKNIFITASDPIEAKQKAVQQIQRWESAHRDYLYELDTLVDMNLIAQTDGYYIHLIKQDAIKPFTFTCSYNPIGKMELC
jgi:Domain of Unknown Function (DUF1543)